MIFLLARRMFIRLLLVLLPLGLFMFLAQAIPLSPLQSLLALVPVIAFEVWLVIRHLLPVMGELVTKTLYSSNITTDEEVLVEASRRMLNSGDPQGALELLERYRKENPGLVRSWLMESSLLICAGTRIPSTSFRKVWNTEDGARRTGLCSCTR